MLRVTLENTSTLDIDWLRLSFSDSNSESTKSYLAETEASSIEVYEIEQEAAERPVLSWAQPTSSVTIAAKSTKILEIVCTGKHRLYVEACPIFVAC